jgi:hypothetical protein
MKHNLRLLQGKLSRHFLTQAAAGAAKVLPSINIYDNVPSGV